MPGAASRLSDWVDSECPGRGAMCTAPGLAATYFLLKKKNYTTIQNHISSNTIIFVYAYASSLTTTVVGLTTRVTIGV